jgi:hypothetical protein
VTAVLTGLGLSAAAGWNAWAVLLLFNGLFLLLPQEFPGSTAALLSSHFAVTAAAILFFLEFVADKIPIVDHVWNLLQTLLRPIVGALLTIAAVPDTTVPTRIGLAIAGAATTLATHLVKSTTRLTSTAATRGMAQLALSLAEDAIALTIGALVFFVPTFTAILLAALAFLLILHRRRVLHGIAVLFFRLKHPRRLLRQS